MAVPAEDEQQEASAAGGAAGDDEGFVVTSAVMKGTIRVSTFCEESPGYIEMLVSGKTNCLMIAPAKRAPQALPILAAMRWRDARVLEARSEITKYSVTDEFIYVVDLSAKRSCSLTLNTSH